MKILNNLVVSIALVLPVAMAQASDFKSVKCEAVGESPQQVTASILMQDYGHLLHAGLYPVFDFEGIFVTGRVACELVPGNCASFGAPREAVISEGDGEIRLKLKIYNMPAEYVCPTQINLPK